jgi:hypothetical protein
MPTTFTVAAEVSPQSYADGTQGPLRGERSGALVVQEASGKYSEASNRGTLFFGGNLAAGVVVPIYSATTQQAVLYNPQGSGFKARILGCWLGYVVGTYVAGHFCYAYNTLTNNAVSGTPGQIVNGLLGGRGSAMQFFSAATVVAMTYLKPFGVSQDVQPATGVNAPWVMYDNVDGAITVLPGQALALAANTAAAGTHVATFLWDEQVVTY